MTQLGLPEIAAATPPLDDNKGSADWIDNGGTVTKKLRHAMVHEARVHEAQKCKETKVQWMEGESNPADSFAEEHKDLAHFEHLRDLMARPRKWVHSLDDNGTTKDAMCETADMMQASKGTSIDHAPVAHKVAFLVDTPSDDDRLVDIDTESIILVGSIPISSSECGGW